MTIETLRRFWQAKPFQQFDVHLADGRSLRVKHPDFLAVAGGGRVIAILDEPDAGEFVDLLLVTSLEKVA